MPQMSGTEATRVIREMGINTTIVALTASVMDGKRDKMLASGMNDFLMKPIIMADLQRILAKWIPAGHLKDPPRKPATGNPQDDEKHKEFWKKIGQIEGLSLSKGLSMVEGQRDTFISMLKLVIIEIEKCDRNLCEFLAAGDMRNFCIEVHSIKSSLTNIGVGGAAQKARELEVASDHEDMAFCAINLPSLLDDLGGLWLGLKEALIGISHRSGAVEVPPELLPVFEYLAHAFHEVDIVAIDEGMERLTALPLPEELEDEIEEFTDAVLMMDYESAMEIMRRLTHA